LLAVAFLEIHSGIDCAHGKKCSALRSSGIFLVHLFEHTLAPHFHFGEETHTEEMSHHRAQSSVMLGLTIHTFFDGVGDRVGIFGFDVARNSDIYCGCFCTSCRRIYGGVGFSGVRQGKKEGDSSGRCIGGRHFARCVANESACKASCGTRFRFLAE